MRVLDHSLQPDTTIKEKQKHDNLALDIRVGHSAIKEKLDSEDLLQNEFTRKESAEGIKIQKGEDNVLNLRSTEKL